MKRSRLRRLIRLWSDRYRRFLRRRRIAFAATAGLLVLLTLTSRLLVAYYLANDEPGDGVVYARLATNLLDHGTYSTDTEEPVSPTLIRMPGYPVFLVGVYAAFGEGNNTAVRIVQAVFDTGTCVLAAIIAWIWCAGRRRRRAAFWAFVLSSLCPFIVIYSALILTETMTTFLMASMALTATLGLRSDRRERSVPLFALTGLIGGMAVMLRPDAGLWVAGVGVALLATEISFKSETKLRARLLGVTLSGAALSIAFLLVLTPWGVRNWRAFGVFQPLSPAHAEMPGEFVPAGYFRWLRTWVDDSRYTEPMLWDLGEKPIRVNSLPAGAFDSPEEKAEVATLVDTYNNPPGSHNKADQHPDADDSANPASDDESGDSASDQQDQADDSSDDSGDPDDDASDEDQASVVKMTPEIDAGFAKIADERIARSPGRYYFWTPLKRAGALWFDSHSLYYPFGGQMSKISDLDHDESQQYWLPFFTLLTWVYTFAGLAGAVVIWRSPAMRRWLLLLALMTLPRIAFFATIENPEPRYLVELFLFTAITGGVWAANRRRRSTERPSLTRERIVSIDILRGVTIAAMVLVNEPGSWDAIYPQLSHSEWNGATVADLVFPFFLFIVGVSIPFALARFASGNAARASLLKIGRRALLLFGLGLLLNVFPIYNLWTGEWFDPSHIRVMGVLQRIAICYAAAALLFIFAGRRTQLALVAIILLGYWLLLATAPVPGCIAAVAADATCNLAGYVDAALLGREHLWSQAQVVDPEGILSTVGAIATTILGLLSGSWLRSERTDNPRITRLFTAGLLSLVIGLAWSLFLPLNKNLWTSSYVLYTAGLAAMLLSGLYWAIDLKGYRLWARPFIVFGTNAIALYVGSSILGMTLNIVELDLGDKTQTLQERIFDAWFLPYAQPINASLLFSIAFLLLWLVLMWTLYRRRIFLRV